ncbi:hemerythrin domain-containing protein [Kovacikia minuta CCNUW1]|uniref:hemerythrin domain-containing protein n=1 Tax=Kovacikia minuta TaxID=2931930 RepID=UPI001CCBE816|nr:hemerythrin domain-containing protein [Kovacikia minuta]UBF23916.1 hemerythrin domain-containing protein [Kovacikia minuta CCNUW1]
MAKAKTGDILSLIEIDHGEVEQLFEKIQKEKSAKKIQELFSQIYQELTLHARAEELVFYPAMREYEETEELIEEAEEEHNAAKILLEEMKQLGSDDEEFKTKLMHLIESVQHHVQEEEEEIFSAVRGSMEDEELQALGQEFQEAKAKVEPDVKTASPAAR